MAGLLPKLNLKDSYKRFVEKKLDLSPEPKAKQDIENFFKEGKHNNITNDDQGKILICGFIKDIFCKYPKLMTSKNKELIEIYSEEIDLQALFEPSPSPKKNLHGG